MRSFSSCRDSLFFPMASPSHSLDYKTWQFPFTASNNLEFCFAFQFGMNPYGKVKTPDKSDKLHLVLAIPCGLVGTVSFSLFNSTLFHDHLYLHLQTWMGLTIASETQCKRAPVCSSVTNESLRAHETKYSNPEFVEEHELSISAQVCSPIQNTSKQSQGPTFKVHELSLVS